MSRNEEFAAGKKTRPSAEDFYNETYHSAGFSAETAHAVASAFNDLEANPPRHFNDCGATCEQMHRHLTSHGVPSRIVEGQFVAGFETGPVPMSRDHVWLTVDGGTILDPTAGQFRGKYDGEIRPEHYRPGYSP